MIRVSVVVPTRNRPELLKRCLKALNAQQFNPKEYEIIVADDANSSVTRAAVDEIRTRYPVDIRYLPVFRKHGPAAARNRGWWTARGGVVAFTDDDCIPGPNWLANGLGALEKDVIAAKGALLTPVREEPAGHESAARIENTEFVIANCFVKRPVLSAVGGLDERFATCREDRDLYFKLIKYGGRIAEAPSAIVVHPVRAEGWGTSVKRQKDAVYDALLYKKHPDLFKANISASPPWLYYGTVLALLSGAAGLAGRLPLVAGTGFAVWAALTVKLCLDRLPDTSRNLSRVTEMIYASVMIPPLAVFWRLRGAFKFKVFFI